MAGWITDRWEDPAFALVREWGGWDSNPGPADYEKYGPAQRTHYLHG